MRPKSADTDAPDSISDVLKKYITEEARYTLKDLTRTVGISAANANRTKQK